MNKKGQIAPGKLIAIALMLLVVGLVIYAWVSGALPALFEKVKGMFDSVLIMLNIKKEVVSSTTITAVILGEERNVALNDNGRCLVEIDGRKFALNFNQNARLEFYGNIYSKEIATPGSAIKDKFLFIFLDQWKWTVYQPLEQDFLGRNYHWFNIRNSVFEEQVLGTKTVPVEEPSRNMVFDGDFTKILKAMFDGYSFEGEGETYLLALGFSKSTDWISLDSPVLNHAYHQREKQIKQDLGWACR